MENYRIELENITKTFPGVVALNNVSFKVRPGSVHAVVGENGAGKSTLMKIINGLYKPDGNGGVIKFNGEVVDIKNPIQARDLGISMIFQELNFIPELTVEENLFLGREKSFDKAGIFLDKKSSRAEAKELISEEGFQYDPKEKMKNLSVSEIQMIEILKAISSKASLIIMDEPTSAITDKEVEILFKKIKELQAAGVSFIYISHRLEEIFEIADDITIIRDGQVVHRTHVDKITNDELITHMVGRKIENIYPKQKIDITDGGLVLKNCFGDKFEDVSLTVKTGEIVGIAGLMGSGRTELVSAIFGMSKLKSGQVLLDGHEIDIQNTVQAKEHGIAMITEDRRTYGFIGCRSVRENIVLASLDDRIRSKLFVNKRAENKIVMEMINLFNVRTASPETDTQNLSGGNQQKVVIAKWLLTNPKILILDEPTRGIDVGSKTEIYTHITNLAKKGLSILMISSEMPELIGMCDRIYVMSRGRIAGQVIGSEMNQETIMKMAIEGVNDEKQN